MPYYGVHIPFAGTIYREVEADDEMSAFDKALQLGFDSEAITEVDVYHQLVNGNILEFNCDNDIFADELDPPNTDERTQKEAFR